MSKKADKQKSKKNNQQSTEVETTYLEEDETTHLEDDKTAYQKFYETYKLVPTDKDEDKDKENKDMEWFSKQFFESNKKLPEFIRPGDLRTLLGKRPGTFCRFLKYPTFLEMVLGESPGCDPEEKAISESSMKGLKIKMEKELTRINKLMEERNNDEKRNAEIDEIKKEIASGFKEIDKIEAELAEKLKEIAEIKKLDGINKEEKEIAKRNTRFNEIEKEIAQGKDRINEIEKNNVNRKAELSKIMEPDERNKSERDDWQNLQKTITEYIDIPKVYSDLVKYSHTQIIVIAKLHDFNKKLIDHFLERDPLPRYIEQKSLCNTILRAPVTMSVLFEYENFFKRLMGFSHDNTQDNTAKEIWKNFLEQFNIKLKTIREYQPDAISARQQKKSGITKPVMEQLKQSPLPVMEQLTQSRYQEILDLIKQNLKSLNEQVEEKKYEKICQDFAEAIKLNSARTKDFLKEHPDPLGVFIEKEIPSCLTPVLLGRLVTFAPKYAFQYIENYFFMERLLGSRVKKGSTLEAEEIFDSLNTGELAKVTDKNMIKLALKHWEMRLRLNIGVTILSNELREFVPTATDKAENTADTLNFSDKQVVDTTIEKLLRISACSVKPREYQWIEQLSALMKKLPESLADEKGVKKIDPYKKIVEEINTYLTETSLLEEIKIKAQPPQQKNTSTVITGIEEQASVSTSLSP